MHAHLLALMSAVVYGSGDFLGGVHLTTPGEIIGPPLFEQLNDGLVLLGGERIREAGVETVGEFDALARGELHRKPK